MTRPFCVYIGPVSRGRLRTGLGDTGLLKSKPEYRRVLAGITNMLLSLSPDIFLRRRIEFVSRERERHYKRYVPKRDRSFITHH